MKCKNCKEKFEPIKFLQKYCLKDECVRVWVESEKAKQWKVKKQKMKNDLETIQELIKATQIIFNKYIRLRDKGQNCISCQKKPLKENAGHYFNANNHWNVRFNELNVHLQCEHCNTYLSGNLIEYRKGLINKIGEEQLTLLEMEAKKTRKFTKDELKEIINTYKKKTKEL
jgi:vacuolar-type H+-ATPase catalytic subunit A/Vma1